MANNKKIEIQSTPTGISKPRPDFRKGDFEIAIHQKGYNVLHEKALHCPCKSKSVGGQLSDCQNCGGTGWAFINPVKTRFIIHSMNHSTEYKEWSEENRGTASISTRDIEEISFMDRVTVLHGISIFNEVRYLKMKNDLLFFSLTYPVKEIEYLALFESPTLPYLQLTEDEDYTIENNFIFLDEKFRTLVEGNEQADQISITVRYKHNPQYHIIDIPRHTMLTNIDKGQREQSDIVMPIHAIGRYTHYVLDTENINGDRIIDNSLPIEESC